MLTKQLSLPFDGAIRFWSEFWAWFSITAYKGWSWDTLLMPLCNVKWGGHITKQFSVSQQVPSGCFLVLLF